MQEPGLDPVVKKYVAFILWGICQGLIAGMMWMAVERVGTGQPIRHYAPFVLPALFGALLAAAIFYPLRGQPFQRYWIGFPLVSALIPWGVWVFLNLREMGSLLPPSLELLDILLPLLWSLPLILLSLLWCLGLFLWQRFAGR